jgi:hypothetical protein
MWLQRVPTWQSHELFECDVRAPVLDLDLSSCNFEVHAH